jgi:hypothetical protein
MLGIPRRHVHPDGRRLVRLLGLALILSVAAGVGMSFVSGFGNVTRRADHAHWWWVGPAFGAIFLAFVGYYFAYRGIRRAEDRPRLERKTMLAVVLAGFGGFLSQGGGALDEQAMRAEGASDREAKVRAMALTAFEQAALALIVCPVSLVAVIQGVAFPRPGFTWPWALIPIPGFLLGALLARRYRDRFREHEGWRGRVGMALDAIHLVVFDLLLRPGRSGLAVAGMLLYWGGDMFGLWATTAAFGYHMSAEGVIVGLASAMILTRRTAPLGGAGLLTVAMIPCLWYASGVPFAAATLGVLLYTLLTLWVPLVPGLLSLPALRELGGRTAVVRSSPRRKRRPAVLPP